VPAEHKAGKLLKLMTAGAEARGSVTSRYRKSVAWTLSKNWYVHCSHSNP
jgi:hypothetical protein